MRLRGPAVAAVVLLLATGCGGAADNDEACRLLLDGGLVEETVDYLEGYPAVTAVGEGEALQERLMAIVWDSPEAGGDRPIAKLAGTLVDVLDNPGAFVVDGTFTAPVRSTLAQIDELCGR